MPDCVFCKIVAREIPAGIVYEDDDQLPYTTFEEFVAAAEEADFADVEDRGSKSTIRRKSSPPKPSMTRC